MTDQWELQCYGTTQAQIDENVKRFGSTQMMAMSILSDVQAEVEITGKIDDERLRKSLNVAKYLISKTEIQR